MILEATGQPLGFSATQTKLFTRGVKVLLNVLVLLLALLGGLELLNNVVDDGSLPKFYALSRTAPGLIANVNHNSTEKPMVNLSPEGYWQSLQGTRKILSAISPEIDQWLVDLHRQNRIRYRLLSLQKMAFQNRDILVSYNGQSGVLHISPTFWYLSDGNKVAYLVHEYRHSRQNRVKLLSRLLTKVITGKLMEYGSPLEDEAHMYQWEAYRAMGIPPESIQEYLRRRNLAHGQFELGNTP